MAEFQELLEMLQNPDPSIRSQAIYALSETDNPLAVEALRRLLWDESKVETHAATLRALGKLGGDRAFDPLLRALEHEHATIRATAARVLGELGDPRAVAPLIDVLQNGQGAQRAAAAEALGELGQTEAVEPLIAVLDDERADVRYAAAAALGELGDERAVAPLIARLDDEATVYGGAVCEAAAESLTELGTPQALAAVEAWQLHWDAAAEEPDTLDAMLDRLQTGEWDARHSAAYVLGELGDVRAVEPLIATLNDPDPVVRQTAVEALGKLGDLRAVGPLVDALDDPETQRAAIVALGAIGDDRAVPFLIDLLPLPAGDVDFAAASALERIGTREALRAAHDWRNSLDDSARFPPAPREV